MAEEKQSDDTLRQEIVEQSKREADSIVRMAEKDAQLILEKARKEADKILKEAEHKADAWKEQIRRRTFSSVKLEIQKQSLRQREKLIVGFLDRAKKRLQSPPAIRRTI